MPDAPHYVVVFGATGLIGGELVKLLSRAPRCAEVIALSRPRRFATYADDRAPWFQPG